jgi:hypothetical protein
MMQVAVEHMVAGVMEEEDGVGEIENDPSMVVPVSGLTDNELEPGKASGVWCWCPTGAGEDNGDEVSSAGRKRRCEE